MSTGRTMWLAQDAARHRRALMVELRADHGPVALACDMVLCAHAKEQNAGGQLRDGFAAIAEETGCTREQARAFIQDAAEIGWLDDLEVDPDGRRFKCRISGWKDDQDKAYAAWRKRDWRNGDTSPTGGDDRDVPPTVPKSPPTAQHSTAQIEEPDGSSREIAKASPDVTRLCDLLADLIRDRDPKFKRNPRSAGWLRDMRLLLADRDGNAAEVERVLRWSQSDTFWQTNILSPTKLRKQFTQLTIRMKADPIRAAHEDQRAAPTRWQDRAEQWAREDALETVG